jgi:hypothetical protein
MQIEYEASRRMRGQRYEEIVSAPVSFDAKSVGTEQATKCFAHLRLVIEHGDDWRRFGHRCNLANNPARCL